MPVLELDGVTKRFGKLVVADDLGFSVEPGDTVGIVGPNGAGKSTLFAMIAGELKPDSGTVTLDGVDVTRSTSSHRARLGIGRTYQVPRPFSNMTVFENVLVCAQEGAHLIGRDAIDRALDIVARTGLADSSNDPASRLNLIKRKRLEVARAWATDPRVILLDEVAGGLTDPEVDELIEIVGQVAASGVAVVWIEHVVRALTATVSHLICLAGGRIVAQGSATDVLADAEVRRLYLGTGAESEADDA